jgi:hypothetical protein
LRSSSGAPAATPGDDVGRLGELQTAGGLVHGVPGPLDVVLGDRVVEVEHALLDPAGVGDEDGEDAVRAEVDELDVAQPAPVEARCDDERGEAGQPGQDARGAAQQVLEVAGAEEQPLDRVELLGRRRLPTGQRVDEEAVARSVGTRPAEVCGWVM